MNQLNEQPIVNRLLVRWTEVLESHPQASFISSPHLIDFDTPENLRAVREGRLVHIVVKRGPFLTARWVPAKMFQFALDAYGETV